MMTNVADRSMPQTVRTIVPSVRVRVRLASMIASNSENRDALRVGGQSLDRRRDANHLASRGHYARSEKETFEAGNGHCISHLCLCL